MRRTIGRVAGFLLAGIVALGLIFINLVAICQMASEGPNRWAPAPFVVMEGFFILIVLLLWGVVFNED